jgi:hypothetical protein
VRDIAASLEITERSAFGIISGLVEAGYVVKGDPDDQLRAALPVTVPGFGPGQLLRPAEERGGWC